MAKIYKKQDDLSNAVLLLEKAARQQHLISHIELAKIYEHRFKNYQEAFFWTDAAINLAKTSISYSERQFWLPELEHRLERLVRKLNS